MPTIYDIQGEWATLVDLLTESGGDISDPEVAKYIDQCFAEIANDLEAKVDGYLRVIAELKARADVRKTEADRLARRARLDRQSVDWMKERLISTLTSMGKTDFETEHYKVKVSNVGGVRGMEIDDGPLPPDFTIYQTVEEPNKELIRNRLEAGEDLPFARLRERSKRLVVS
tara:strand:- start:10632 stop:11147 length:516 start_codon:yes stop_codon:yes gene_type:complete